MENQEKKMVAEQIGYLKGLHSEIIEFGEAVLTQKDSTIIEEITQTINALKLYMHVQNSFLEQGK